MCLTEYNEEETMQRFKEEGREEGREETALQDIRKLMKNLKFTAKQAMDSLEISPGEQKKYISML